MQSEASVWFSTCSILTVLSMSANIERKRFTFNDWEKMAEVGILSPPERVELIDGYFILMKPPSSRHASIVAAAAHFFSPLFPEKAGVWCQNPIFLDPFAVPLPDIVLVRPREDFYAERLPKPEDIFLIIEVANTSLEYDLSVKLQLYAIAGISEYWVADLRNDRLIVHAKPVGDLYAEVRELHRGETLAPLRLPEKRVPVDLLLP
jgi:Uma2 family endonuclease